MYGVLENNGCELSIHHVRFWHNGHVSDGEVIQNTDFFNVLQPGILNIPHKENFKNLFTTLSYVFVADIDFLLRTDMLKPFRFADINSVNRIVHNYRVSKARRIVENVLGILNTRFRIFHMHAY